MKYKCHLCDYEKDIIGKTDDGPIRVHSKVLGVTAIFSCSLVKGICEAEIRHVMATHMYKYSKEEKE
jgi:hypothetical protein